MKNGALSVNAPLPTTPPRDNRPLPPETASFPHHTSLQDYRTGDLKLGRTAVLNEINKVPILPLSHFQDFILPPSPSKSQISLVKEHLKAARIIDDNGWTAFPKPPASLGPPESDTFAPLQKIFGEVVAAQEPIVANTHFLDTPSKVPKSERKNTSRPDAIVHLNALKSFPMPDHKERDIYWDDIAVSLEYKKVDDETNRNDNNQKVLWSMHHIMRSDPCRRFTFGITVENENMKVWYINRSVVCVSKPFNFLEEIDSVIQIFSSFAFANATELGWDDTMERVDRDVYDITMQVKGKGKPEVKVYRTISILSNAGADGVCGRGTRVFKAKEKGRDCEVVIKDVWQDMDRRREGDLMDDIFAAIRKSGGDSKVEEARQYFLTVLHHGDVMLGDQADSTLAMMRGERIPNQCKLLVLILTPSDTARNTHGKCVGAIPQELSRAFRRIPIRNQDRVSYKAHYRIVFKEEGTPIHALREFKTMLQALQDATRALMVMHSVGYVHRDVSAGNVLCVGGRGKLADLEYAKPVDEPSSHYVRTGTPNFMSVEVEARNYQFTPQKSKDEAQPQINAILNALEDESQIIEPAITKVEDGAGKFRHNQLHDLESIWWLAVFLHFYFVESHVTVYPGAAEQEDALNDLFPGYVGSPVRFHALSIQAVFETKTRCLPDIFRSARLLLEAARYSLATGFATAERTYPVKHDGMTEHETFLRVFRLLSAKLNVPSLPVKRLREVVPREQPSSTPPSPSREPNGDDERRTSRNDDMLDGKRRKLD